MRSLRCGAFAAAFMLVVACGDEDPAAPITQDPGAAPDELDALALEWIGALENASTREWLSPFVAPDASTSRLAVLREIRQFTSRADTEADDPDLPVLAALELLYAAEQPPREAER